jgi:hypothetical protein
MPDDTRSVDERRAMTSHHRPGDRRPFECGALLLRGDGALGSYQEPLVEADRDERLKMTFDAECVTQATLVSSPDAGASYDV